MNFRPLRDRVVVRRLEEHQHQKTTNGIIIPGTASEGPSQGKIIVAGRGARDESAMGSATTAGSSANGRAPRSRLMVRGLSHHEGERHPRNLEGVGSMRAAA
jgi:hypothetical protein